MTDASGDLQDKECETKYLWYLHKKGECDEECPFCICSEDREEEWE